MGIAKPDTAEEVGEGMFTEFDRRLVNDAACRIDPDNRMAPLMRILRDDEQCCCSKMGQPRSQ